SARPSAPSRPSAPRAVARPRRPAPRTRPPSVCPRSSRSSEPFARGARVAKDAIGAQSTVNAVLVASTSNAKRCSVPGVKSNVGVTQSVKVRSSARVARTSRKLEEAREHLLLAPAGEERDDGGLAVALDLHHLAAAE